MCKWQSILVVAESWSLGPLRKFVLYTQSSYDVTGFCYTSKSFRRGILSVGRHIKLGAWLPSLYMLGAWNFLCLTKLRVQGPCTLLDRTRNIIMVYMFLVPHHKSPAGWVSVLGVKRNQELYLLRNITQIKSLTCTCRSMEPMAL